MSISPALVRYVLIGAVRDRLVLGLVVMMGMAISLSAFLGSAAVLEQDKFVAVYAAGTIRLLNAMGLVLFTVFFIRRSFEARDIDLMLARPVSRLTFLLSYLAALWALGLGLAAVSGGCVAALSPHNLHMGHVVWAVSLAAENIILVSASMFFAMILSSPASAAFAVTGFYVLARLMSQILGILDSGKAEAGALVLKPVMQGISMVMPRLDLFAQSSWLIYGPDSSVSLFFILAQGLVYTGVLACAAGLDLGRRQF